MCIRDSADAARKLTAAGIPTLALKGAALVESVYDSLGQRPMNDLDILVPAGQAAAAAELLLAEGYRWAAPTDLAAALEFENELMLRPVSYTHLDSFFVSGRASWLADLVADGHWTEAVVETLRHVRRLGPQAVLRSDSLRRLAARLTGRSERRVGPPPWLTRHAAALVAESPPDGPGPTTRRLPRDARAVWASLNQSNGIATGDGEHRAGVEVRDPFADGELVSLSLIHI